MPPITTPTTLPPLEEDVFCGCGYNLRGLEPDGRCPECGRAIQLALSPPRKPVSSTQARLVMCSCVCFLLAVYLIHHEWFIGRTQSHSPRLIAATAMAAGCWLLSLVRMRPRGLSDALHAALLRWVPAAWLVVVIFLEPGLLSGIRPEDVDGALLFFPAASLYLMLEALSRWHARLGGRALARVIRVTSWVLPLAAIWAHPTFWRFAHLSFMALLPRRGSDLVLWGVTVVFLIAAFLIGVTCYASLDAAGEPPRHADRQN